MLELAGTDFAIQHKNAARPVDGAVHACHFGKLSHLLTRLHVCLFLMNVPHYRQQACAL